MPSPPLQAARTLGAGPARPGTRGDSLVGSSKEAHGTPRTDRGLTGASPTKGRARVSAVRPGQRAVTPSPSPIGSGRGQSDAWEAAPRLARWPPRLVGPAPSPAQPTRTHAKDLSARNRVDNLLRLFHQLPLRNGQAAAPLRPGPPTAPRPAAAGGRVQPYKLPTAGGEHRPGPDPARGVGVGTPSPSHPLALRCDGSAVVAHSLSPSAISAPGSWPSAERPEERPGNETPDAGMPVAPARTATSAGSFAGISQTRREPAPPRSAQWPPRSAQPSLLGPAPSQESAPSQERSRGLRARRGVPRICPAACFSSAVSDAFCRRASQTPSSSAGAPAIVSLLCGCTSAVCLRRSDGRLPSGQQLELHNGFAP